MKARIESLLPLLTAIAIGACSGSQAEEASGTDATTRDLLATPAGNGMSTPLALDTTDARKVPPVAVSSVGINRGSVEAPVKVVELTDYGCGFCRQFHEESFPTLREQFIDTGKVEWKFIPFITGMFQNSLAATEAIECTYAQSTDAFETLNRRLWDDQPEWKGSNDPEGVIRGWVAELEGVDMNAFDQCLSGDERIYRVANSTTLAQQLGVRATPTIVVLGWPPIQGALPLGLFQEVLNAAHVQAVRAMEQQNGGGAPDGDSASGNGTSGEPSN